jgi:predicted small secreted protein
MKPFVLAVVLLTTLAACNTIQGAGKDIENAGEAVSDAAQKTKEKMK